jgi:hypothetical protein
MAEYDVFAVCNACGDLHPLGISVTVDDGPVNKQSIADAYEGKDLPQSLAALKDRRVYCPKTGRQYSQRDTKKILLVPRR